MLYPHSCGDIASDGEGPEGGSGRKNPVLIRDNDVRPKSIFQPSLPLDRSGISWGRNPEDRNCRPASLLLLGKKKINTAHDGSGRSACGLQEKGE